jgi:alkylation response protein AidB-like acyl-CoA dehydrogenase
MEIMLTEDQDFFRETTERFLSTECPTTVVRELATVDTGWDPSYWRQGAELGWTCLVVGEDSGGGSISGNGLTDLSIVAESFGRHAAPGPLMAVNIVANTISRIGSDEQRAQVLPGLLSGDSIATWCGMEHAIVGGGSGPTASLKGDEVVISGSSSPVEAAASADWLLVTAMAETGPVQVLVQRDAPGLTIEALRGLDLVRRFARVTFDGVTVPRTALIGDPSTTADDVEHQLQVAVTLQVAEMAGAAERTFAMTLEWAFDRYSFGRPLASYQELKHRFADMKMWLEASHALATAAARDIDAGAPKAAMTASASKAYAGHYLALLMQDCVQIHGGIGLTTDHDLHLFLRRVTVNRSLHGTPALHRARLARLAA